MTGSTLFKASMITLGMVFVTGIAFMLIAEAHT